MERIRALSWAGGVRTVWCSAERKARESAEILAGQLCLRRVFELPALGENDRSSTGYLLKTEFELTAAPFFARPEEGIRRWERAVDAQIRIGRAVEQAIAGSAESPGDFAIVAHGGVGALLLCHLGAHAIGRQHDQPPNEGGNHFAFDAATRRLRHD